MNRALIVSALFSLLTLPLTACVDDMGGDPLPADGPPAWRLGGVTETEMAERATRLAECVPIADAFAQRDPAGLLVGGLRVVEDDQGATLELELINVSPFSFMAYPALVVEVLDGELALHGGLGNVGPGTHVSQYYGIFGCGRYVTRIPLPAAAEVDGPITLRAAATDLHPGDVFDEWAFVLDPR